MDFEEYFRKNFNDGLSEPSKYILRFTFEAGQQSNQAEIDRIVSIITEAYKSDGDSSVETVYDKIQELLK